MNLKNRATALLSLSAMLALIFDSAASTTGCREGIELCIKNVIPALLPFLVLSPIISTMDIPLPRWLHKVMKLPDGADSLWLGGCLGGYPVGAQCIARAVERGQITEANARRLMSFCCNCGPGFVFGVSSALFTVKWAPWGLWLCHIAGSVLIGWTIPADSSKSDLSTAQKFTIMDAFAKGLKAMAQICGWVILFRCLLEFLQRCILHRLGVSLRVVIIGALELTNGCFSLTQIHNEALRFMICEGMLCFGGLCVAMQTASIGKKIPMAPYFAGKVGQAIISTILAGSLWSAIHGNLWTAVGVILLLLSALAAIKTMCKNYSRNLSPVGV